MKSKKTHTPMPPARASEAPSLRKGPKTIQELVGALVTARGLLHSAWYELTAIKETGSTTPSTWIVLDMIVKGLMSISTGEWEMQLLGVATRWRLAQREGQPAEAVAILEQQMIALIDTQLDAKSDSK